MKKVLNKFLFVFILISSNPLLSQIDTCFWFAAPWVTPDHTNRNPIFFHFAGKPFTVVKLRQPGLSGGNQYNVTFTLSASGNYDLLLNKDAIASSTNIGFDSLEVKPANTVRPYGIYISSVTNPITVVYDVVTAAPTYYNPETYSLKGQNGLGKEFICPFQTIYDNKTLFSDINGDAVITQPKQQINIVGTKPNTIVWITPKCSVVGHVANTTYSVLLANPGDAYTVENSSQATSTPSNNLSGTIVVADKDIAVTISDDSVNKSGQGCFDLMGDQIVPIDALGTDYIVNRGKLNAAMNESAYIVATENSTQLTINNGTITTATLNKGDSYRFGLTTDLTYFNANKNVYCMHVSGFGCEVGEAILPPINCAGSQTVTFSRTNNQQFMLNILCKSGSQSTFTLNNAAGSVTVPISPSNFTVVPGTATMLGGPYYGTQLNLNSIATLPIGTYSIANSTDVFALGVFAGDLATGGLFHYMSTFLRKIIVDAGADTTICDASPTLTLSGVVSGATSTGMWTTNGTGTIVASTSLTTIYRLSLHDLTLSQIQFTLSSTGVDCKVVNDIKVINIVKAPVIYAGLGATLCSNNITAVPLNGAMQNAVGTNWTSTGDGAFGNPGILNTTYLPGPNDLAANGTTITLTSIGAHSACPNRNDTLKIKYNPAPMVNIPFSTLHVCANNPTVAITGTISPGFTSVWSTSGTGLFTPSTTSINTVYQLSVYDLGQVSIKLKFTSNNNGNCIAVSDSVKLIVDAIPFVDAGPPVKAICFTDLFTALNGTVTGITNTGVWSTLGDGTFDNASNLTTMYNIGVADKIAGQVKLVLRSTGSNCLAVRDTLLLKINAPSAIAIGAITQPTNAIITGDVELVGLPTGNWIINPGAISGTGTSTIITGLLPGTYNYSVTNSSGCTSQSSADVTISNIITNIKAINTLEKTLTIFPNPTSSQTNIIFTLDKAEDLTIQLIDIQGKLVYSENKKQFKGLYEKTIDISKLSKGTYSLIMDTESKHIKRNIIIE